MDSYKELLDFGKEYLREKKITDSQILFIHTGGAPLFYDCLGNGDV